MIRVALSLGEIRRQVGGRICGALSIAGYFERNNIVVGAVEICGIKAIRVEGRQFGINGIAFPDQEAESEKAGQG
jgi:hypothetical protein